MRMEGCKRNLGFLLLNSSFAFWCFRHRSAASLGIAPKPVLVLFTLSLHFCIFALCKMYGGVPIYNILSY